MLINAVCFSFSVVFHGILIVGLSYFTSLFQSVLQGVVVLDGIILGPTLGVFTLGILTQATHETVSFCLCL